MYIIDLVSVLIGDNIGGLIPPPPSQKIVGKERVKLVKGALQKIIHLAHAALLSLILSHTICPSSDPFYMVTYFIERGHFFLDIQ